MKKTLTLTLVKPFIAVLSLSVSAYAFAGPTFTLDSLLKAGNDDGHGSFTLTNTNDETVYVKGEVIQIKVEEGDIKKIPLTKENFLLWDLSINPSKLQLLPGEVRDVAVKYLCQKDCDRSKDSVYQIRFTPVSAPVEMDGQKVVFAFGLAPYYIVPALTSEVDYEWNYDEDAHVVSVYNKGNTYLKIEFDNCNNNLRSERRCRAVFNVLSGRKLDIKLEEGLQGNNVNVTVADHDQRFEDEFIL